MTITLFASLAANALAALAIMWLFAKLSTARDDSDDAQEALADLKVGYRTLEQVNGSLLTELTDYRARQAKQLAPLAKANAERSANAKSRVNAH